mmetsp:Transcript_1157/g.2036  ORF Transcript_1157/g.2036 Transcript_1157/m.2036 type:complete len:454 (+) Transcript_1157:328-1689(+)
MFTVIAFLSPLLGGWLADSVWGKYKTILRLSWVHLLGNAMLAFCALPIAIGPSVQGDSPRRWPSLLGLFVTGLGTGGIKPCVSAFAGDQFHSTQHHLMSSFFSYFYMSISVGALLGIFITPMVRTYVSYSLAFAIPALLMFFALVMFVMGRIVGYTEVEPGGNVLGLVWGVVYVVVRRGSEAARAKYGDQSFADVSAVFKVVVILLPTSIFWSLYDQQMSKWTFQALHMDRTLGSHMQVDPDMMMNLSSILVLVLTPIFNILVYPACRRLDLPVTSLWKMFMGMLCAAVAFVVSGLVQQSVDAGAEGSVSVWWQVPQYVVMTSGEILLSITLLEFSYCVSPPHLKSVVTSLAFLTIALGNFLDVIVMSINPFTKSAEMFFFAFLQVLVMGIYYGCVRFVGVRLCDDDKTIAMGHMQKKTLSPSTRENGDDLSLNNGEDGVSHVVHHRHPNSGA